MRKKLVICLALSVAAIALLVLGGWFSSPRRADGSFYWDRILGGTGREIGRRGDRVDFFWAGHLGWNCYKTTVQEIDAARVEAARRLVDDLVPRYLAGDQSLAFHMRYFELLTGYDHLGNTIPPDEWWKENRDKVQPTARQVQAFLDERRKVVVLAQIALNMASPPEQMEGYNTLELVNGRTALIGRPYLLGPEGDKVTEQYRVSHRKFWSFLFEAFYFPALIFYIAYGVTFVLRWLRAKRWPQWTVCAVGAVLINVGVMLPYVFGYAPCWMTTANDDKTILYNVFLSLCELPMILVLTGLGDLTSWAGSILDGMLGEYVAIFILVTITCGILGALFGLVLKGNARKT